MKVAILSTMILTTLFYVVEATKDTGWYQGFDVFFALFYVWVAYDFTANYDVVER